MSMIGSGFVVISALVVVVIIAFVAVLIMNLEDL